MDPQNTYLRKLRTLGILNRPLVARILSQLDPSHFISPDHIDVYFVTPLHFGSSSEVSELTARIKGDKRFYSFILKRYLPPEQRHLMDPSQDPQDDEKHLREHDNLLLFQTANPHQPKLYHNDPSRRLLVLETKDGSYDTLLSEQFLSFCKASRNDEQRIRHQIHHDLDQIIETAIHLMETCAPRAHTKDFDYNGFSRTHLRNLGAAYDVCTRLTLAAIGKERGETRRKQRLVALLDTSRAMQWTRKYDRKEEAERLFDYVGLREALVHTDMRPENVLFETGDQQHHFSLCDLSDLRRGPSDLDIVSLLIDPRVTGMFSLEELREIHNRHYQTLQKMYAGQLSTKFTPAERFTLAAVHGLLDDMGAVFHHLKQTNPDASPTHAEDYHQHQIGKVVPLGNIPEYFARQYLTLFHVLHDDSKLLPNLYRGVSEFVPAKTRQALEERLHQEKPSALWQMLSHLWKRGTRWLSFVNNNHQQYLFTL